MVVSSLPVKARHEDNLTRAIWCIWIMDGEAYESPVLSGSLRPGLGLESSTGWQAEETSLRYEPDLLRCDSVIIERIFGVQKREIPALPPRRK